MSNNLSYSDKLKELSKDTLINSIIEEKTKNARISFALQVTQTGIWEWDTATDKIFLSAECFTMLGYESTDGYYDYDWLRKKVVEEDYKSLGNITEKHVKAYPYNRELEFRMIDSEGKEIWVRSIGKVKNELLSASPILIGTLDNISGKKNLQQELIKHQKHLESLINERTKEIEKQNLLLKERERAFSTLLQNMQGMAYRYQNDPNWTLLYVSEGSKELTGYDVTDFMSMIIRMETHILHEEYSDPVWEEITKCLNEKRSFKVNYPITTKTGEEKWVLDRGRGVYDAKGNLIYLEGVIVDISEQKHQELKYKMAQETMDKAPIAIKWIRKDGSFQYVNDVAIKYSGYSKDEFLKLKIQDIDPSLNKENWEKLFEKRMVEEIKDLESTYTRKDGSNIPVLINATNIVYEGESLNVSFINEISDIKKARNELQQAYNELAASEEELRQRSEELNAVNDHLTTQKNTLEEMIIKLRETQGQLVQAEKMASLGVLVAGIAHELNNPINYISTGADALRIVIADVLEIVHKYKEINKDNFVDKLDEIDRLRVEFNFDDLLDDLLKMGENINVGAEQAANIVRGLKSFSRMDSGELGTYDVHEIIDNVLLMLYNNYKYRITLQKVFGDIPEIECFPSKLSQVFMNLITNAIQSIENEGEIKITTSKEGKEVVISVEDTGKGISKELESRIFEPFFTTKDTGQGTGLGLSITLGIIEDHGGKIELKSEEGKGTAFMVRLPIKQ